MKNFLVIVEFHDFYGYKHSCELIVMSNDVETVNKSAFMIFANEIAKKNIDFNIQRMSITKIKQYYELPKEKFKIN